VDYGKKPMTLAGLVVGFSTKVTKKGKKMGFITLDDRSARLEAVIYEEQLDLYQDLIKTDEVAILRVTVSKNFHDDGLRVVVDEVHSLDAIRGQLAKNLSLQLDKNKVTSELLLDLKNILVSTEDALCSVRITLIGDESNVDLVSHDEWRIKPTEEMLKGLKSTESIVLGY